MDAEGSVTQWISLLKRGDRAAAPPLWQAYFHRLVALARHRLRSTTRGAVDEEDVALAAFDSFYRRAEGGQFPRLDDRDDLWQILSLITVRKSIDLLRREVRHPGGAAREHSDADFEQILGTEPTPEFVALVADECRRLLDCLGAELRVIAQWKMEGETNAEIATRLGCVETTVERKLRRIRQLWEREDVS